ncbi:MAG: single-stranded DNA-binding protein, partial [Actinomycetota bacterium]|nr:single-stranded DNA-binding protein [Actinomycetota bacterium]
MNESFVTVVGNVVADPVTRPTKVGRPFASLRVASTTRRWDPETRAFIDGNTNYVNVAAFNALAANVMASVRRGHPVVVYGRLRVNQWQTDKGEPRTSVEIDAYTIGHDLSRGQSLFTKPDRVQLDTNDRLADQAIQESFDKPRDSSHEGVARRTSAWAGWASRGAGSAGVSRTPTRMPTRWWAPAESTGDWE